MKLLNKCPICGGVLYTDTLYQFSYIRKINKSGKENKTRKKTSSGLMECYAIYCENMDFQTNYDLEVIEPKDFNESIYMYNDIFYLKGG